MKEKIKEIAESIWIFIQAVSALVGLALIASIVLFLAFSAIFLAVWGFDKLFLGGVMFG